MPEFYGDGSLSARIYDADHPDGEGPIEGDCAFYRELARESGGPVLELGAGTGRVALPLAEAGFEVVGLELSESMLEVARARAAQSQEQVRRRLSLVQGDMADFALGGKFALVIIAFRSFQLLRSLEAQRSCLGCVHRHLAPGGRLAVHLFDPLLETVTPGTFGWAESQRKEEAPIVSGSGSRIDRTLVYRTNDTVSQRFEEVWRFREYDADGVVVREGEEVLRMRWIFRNEMRYLLELCGFEVEAEYSDFFGSPPAYAKEQVWVARRKDV